MRLCELAACCESAPPKLFSIQRRSPHIICVSSVAGEITFLLQQLKTSSQAFPMCEGLVELLKRSHPLLRSICHADDRQCRAYICLNRTTPVPIVPGSPWQFAQQVHASQMSQRTLVKASASNLRYTGPDSVSTCLDRNCMHDKCVCLLDEVFEVPLDLLGWIELVTQLEDRGETTWSFEAEDRGRLSAPMNMVRPLEPALRWK